MQRTRVIEYTWIVIAALTYYGLARSGMALFSLQPSNVTLIWLPSGIALAMCLQWGYKAFPFITLASFAANLPGMTDGIHNPYFPTGVIALSDGLAGMIAMRLFQRFLPNGLNRINDILPFGLWVCLIPTSISSIIMSVDLVESGYIAWSEISSFLRMLILGDSLGILLVYPIYQGWQDNQVLNKNGRRWLGGAVMALVALLSLGFTSLPATVYFTVPLLLLLSFNVNLLAISSVSSLTMLSIITATAKNVGPFVDVTPAASGFEVIAFVFSSALTILGVALLETQRKLSERALWLNDAKLRSAQEIARFGSYVTNLETGNWISSPELDAIFGIDGNYVHDIPNWNLILAPEFREPALQHYLEVARDRKPFRMDYQIVRPVDGVRRWIAANGELEYDANGKPVRLIGTIQDITERKESELLAQENAAKFRKLAETSPAPLALIDEQQNIIYINHSFKRTFGYTLNDIPTLEAWWPLAYPDLEYRQWVISEWAERTQEALEKDATLEGFEVRVRCKDGTYRTVLASSSFMTHQSQDAQLIILYDITDRKQIEEELERHRMNLEELVRDRTAELERSEFLRDQALDLARSGHWHIDYSEGDEYYVSSERVVEIFGDPPREKMRYHIMNDWYVNIEAADKAAAEATLENYLSAVNGTRSRYDMIHPYKRPKDGQVVWIHVLGQVVRDAQGKPTYVYGVVMDITELMHSQLALLEAKEQAEKANQAKSTFLSNMSHELRTPMHAILSYGSLGLEASGSGNVDAIRYQKYFDRIVSSGERLMLLINDLLDLSKLEAGKLELQRGQHQLLEMTSQALHELSILAKKREIEIDVSGIPSNISLECDGLRMGQVIRNLLSNAIKFSPEAGEITIYANLVSFESIGNGQAVEFSVHDMGPGIPEDEIEYIFSEFSQSSKTSNKFGGTGLGLAICKQIIGLHGGTIFARNNEDKGTTFTFVLPLHHKNSGLSKS